MESASKQKQFREDLYYRLGVSRLTLREKLTQFGLHPAQEQREPS